MNLSYTSNMHEEPSTSLDAKNFDVEDIETDATRQSKWEVLINTGDIKW